MVVGVLVVASVSVDVTVIVATTVVTETVSTIVVCQCYIVSFSCLSRKVEHETFEGDTAPTCIMILCFLSQ